LVFAVDASGSAEVALGVPVAAVEEPEGLRATPVAPAESREATRITQLLLFLFTETWKKCAATSKAM
jgi:hypothetical protein